MLIKLKHESCIKFECRLRSPAQCSLVLKEIIKKNISDIENLTRYHMVRIRYVCLQHKMSQEIDMRILLTIVWMLCKR